jgi:hypothetical protein
MADVVAFLYKVAEEAARLSVLAIASAEGALLEIDCDKKEFVTLDLLAWSARAEAVVLRSEADLALEAIDLSSLAEALILVMDSDIATMFEVVRLGDGALAWNAINAA